MSWRVWLAFAVLCALSACASLVAFSGGDAWSGVRRQGVELAAVGTGAGLCALIWNGGRARLKWRSRLLLAVGGLGFFGVPALFFAGVTSRLTDTICVAAFSAIPVAVVVIESLSRDDTMRLLLPSLAGLGGLLLLLPLEMPADTAGWIPFGGLIVTVLLIAALSVWLHKALQGVGFAEATAAVCLPPGLGLLLCGHGGQGFGGLPGAWILVSGAVSTLLTVWLLREMRPVRFAARYLIVPLLVLAVGFVLWTPRFTIRMGCGIALLTCGAALLLMLRCDDKSEVLSLR